MSFTRTLRAVGGAAVAGALLFGTAPVASADSIRDDQWPLTAFDAEKVWAQSTGKGVTVAVIDGAVDGTHPDLAGNVLSGKSFIDGGVGNKVTSNDHGTAMASLIAAHGHGAGSSSGVMGLAPDAKILPVEINLGTSASTEWAEALRYAVDQGASVVNMSFDVGGVSITSEEEAAIAYAAENDVLIVGGTGNDGVDRVSYPAAAAGVIAVGAIGKDGVVWEESNYGSQLMLTAPGEYIRSASAGGGYHLANGTSDATAYVSAAAALLRSKFPDLTAGQIANRLVKTAGLPSSESDLSLPDERYGYGFIRPYSALTKDVPAGSEQGPLKTPAAAASSSPSPTSGGSDASDPSASSDSSGIAVFVAIGIAVLVIVIILVIVLSKRGNRRNGPPPGGPGGWGGPGAPGGGSPYPPQQAGPPAGYPQHQPNPYASQQQPPNQWPSQ